MHIHTYVQHKVFRPCIIVEKLSLDTFMCHEVVITTKSNTTLSTLSRQDVKLYSATFIVHTNHHNFRKTKVQVRG